MATRYCGPSNTGSGSGADFNNLLALPNNTGFTRGDVYVIVDGSYGAKTLSTATSGTSTITIRKASAANSGVAGYSSTLHDGVASFGGITTTTQYWIVDGMTRAESATWDGPAGYGISASELRSNGFSGDDGDNSQYRYINVGPTYQTTHSSGWGVVLYFTLQANITFHRCAVHNGVGTLFQGSGSQNITFEYCDIGPGWGKEAIRGGNGSVTSGWVIRYCRFWESSQTDPDDGTSGITAEIGIWDWTGTATGIAIYGNWFYNSKSGGRNACIVVGGNGSSWAGGGADGTVVYNNTFAGMPEAGVFGMVDLNGSSTVARNNLFYDTAGVSISASTTSNNVDAGADPFVNYAGRDFHLDAATSAGTSLSSPYDIDMDGVTRGADGTWDVGAFEYDAGSSPPGAPSNFMLA